MASTTRVWHITGANTGLGLELALKALSEGDRVIAAVRSPGKVPLLLQRPEVAVLQFDLGRTQDEMNSYATKAFAAFKGSNRVDVVVNNAGFAYMGAIEETEDEYVRAQFDTNVFAMARLIRAFLPGLRAQGSTSGSDATRTALIMNLSSIGGYHGYASNGIYCATKFAVEGMSQALEAEVAPFGIGVAIVEPGYFRTDFLANPAAASRSSLAPPMSVYEGTPAHDMRAAFTLYNGRQPGNPAEGAARMWEYAAGKGCFEGKKRLLRLPLGNDAGKAMLAHAKDLEETAREYEAAWSSTDFKDE